MIDQAVRKQQQYYEQTAADYQQMHVVDGDEHYRALSYIATMARVWGISSFLDVGSGTGRAVEFLHDQGFQVRGVEPVNAGESAPAKHRPTYPMRTGGVSSFCRWLFRCGVRIRSLTPRSTS